MNSTRCQKMAHEAPERVQNDLQNDVGKQRRDFGENVALARATATFLRSEGSPKSIILEHLGRLMDAKSGPWGANAHQGSSQVSREGRVRNTDVPKWLPSVQNAAHSVTKVSQKAPMRVPKVPKSRS